MKLACVRRRTWRAAALAAFTALALLLARTTVGSGVLAKGLDVHGAVPSELVALSPNRAAPLPTLVSSDGRALPRLLLLGDDPTRDLWAWTPARTTIVSGDNFRDRARFTCDDGGCRFTAAQLVDRAVVFVKIPQFDEALRLVTEAGVHAVFVHGAGDEFIDQRHADVLGSQRLLRGLFPHNLAHNVRPTPAIVGVPLGVERVRSPRGRFPGMYLHQPTGFNLAAKLCWAPVLALELGPPTGGGGGGEAPRAALARDDNASLPSLLLMNFRTRSNPVLREAARAAFAGRPWVTDNVNAGDAVDTPAAVTEAAIEAALRALWRRHARLTSAPWFRQLCGPGPLLPRGLDPALVSALGLPGYPHFLKAMSLSPFVLAPEGNGVSTHRAWEAMYAGAVAVVREVSPMLDGQYRGLPAMLVTDWAEATPRALVCFGVELFAKAAGRSPGGAAGAGALGGGGAPPGFATSAAGAARELDALDSGGGLAAACAASIAAYAAAHPATHAGYLSLAPLDYEWWHAAIARHAARMFDAPATPPAGSGAAVG